MTKRLRSGAVLALTLGLAACSASDCDPSKGGFVRGIGCMAGGGYDQRISDRRGAVDQERTRQAHLQQDYEQSRAQQEAVRAQRQAAERQYSVLKRDLEAMKAKLAGAKTGRPELQRQVSDLQTQVSMLERDAASPEAEKAQRLEALLRKKTALEQEIDLALQR